MAETPVLGLPLMETSQGGSSTIYNEAMTILDTATGGGGGAGVPGGTTSQAQYKVDAATFGGSSGLTLSATQVTGITLASPLPLAQGGTGATTQAGAQAALGLVPGTTVQTQDAELSALAALTSASDRLPYFTGAGSAALAVCTAVARAFLDDPDTATQRTTLGLKALAVLDTVATPQIDNSAVTYAKLQNVSGPPRVLGRYSAGAGVAQELTLGAGLAVDGAGVITAAGGGGGSTTLLGLTDVPDTYTGQASKVLAVRSDETGTEFITPAAGGGGAPTDAEYVTSTANASLSAERVLTDTATITWDRTTAGQIKANAIGGGGYTDEQAQDAVGAMLTNTSTVTLTYVDATPALNAAVNDASITEAKLSLSDVTTRDASTSAHGLLKKLSGTATQYLDGSGAWTTPAGGGGGDSFWSRVDLGQSTLATGILAFWPLEEATGNRLDSVGINHLVPTGSGVQVSNAAGRIGQALAMNGTPVTYLSVPDNATLSAGANQSFTVACWVSVATTSGNMGFVGKGTATPTSNTVEYMLWQYMDAWNFMVGNGSAFVNLASPFTPIANQWCLLIGWYDADADMQYLQVNNGTPAQVANTAGSYDSTLPFEIGRTVGFASQSLNGRLDMPAFWKRVLTAQERADYWQNGNGLAYPFGTPARLSPSTVSDQVLLAGSALTQERLELDAANGAIKLGTAVGLIDGTLRWSGTDFEGRKGGIWVSLTAGGGAGGGTTETRVETLAVYNVTQTGTVTQAAHWAAASQTTNTLWWRVPTSYAGGNVTITLLRRASATGGTALMQLLAFRLRDGTAASAAILTQTVDFTPVDTLTHALTVTLLAAEVTIGDVFRVDLARDGAHASDTLDLVLYDGASVAYTALQPSLDATLAALGGLATGADQLPYATGTDTFAQTTLTAFARTLLDDTTQAAMRTTLALTPGTDVQAQDAELQAIAGLASVADRVPYFTGTGTAALATFTAAGRTLAGAADAAAQRTALALGTMAQQDAASVAITGGHITLLAAANSAGLYVDDAVGNDVMGVRTAVSAGTGRYNLYCGGNAPNLFSGSLGVRAVPLANVDLYLALSAGVYGVVTVATDQPNAIPLEFRNQALVAVGSIGSSATATAYNTSSDARLKHAIAPLAGALDVVRRLRPITHLWNADDSRGYGFLAHELQQVIPDAVSGEADAVNEDGSVKPQQVDHSRLVPWLTAACQDLAAQVTALSARVASLEEQLGV